MTTQSVARALDLLDALGRAPQSLEDCAARLDVHKSTALRLLQTMEQRGFVHHDDRHRYRLGRRVFALAAAALDGFDVRALARPHLEELNAATGQTVHLAAYQAGEAVYIDKLEARAGVRMYSRIGLAAPLHATAVGKVLVAALPAATRAAVAGRLVYTPFTERTLRTPERYRAELDRVRARGWARDRREHESFVNCLAAPLRDGSGAVVAAASLSVPTVSLDERGVRALLPALLRAAAGASAELGWSGPADAGSSGVAPPGTASSPHPAKGIPAMTNEHGTPTRDLRAGAGA